MFNAPRATQRSYGSTSANGLGGSFIDENPLAASVYDGLDPWSAAPTPSPPPMSAAPSAFSSVIADATVPAIYHKSFAAVDVTNEGETSVNALSRVLGTSSLPAATIDRIVNLVSSRPRVTKLEFFVALALVALAQAGKDVSIEQIAALASQNSLPEPSLNLDSLSAANPSLAPFPNFRLNSGLGIRSPAPTYATEDPWSTAHSGTTGVVSGSSNILDIPGASGTNNGAPSNVSGTGLPNEWWKKQDTISVAIQGQQGFILNRYTVYEIITDRGAPILRRYSEFVYLWECLIRRYPFRLIPALPPKRLQPDDAFVEQRRKGLARSLNFVINHPVIKGDGLLSVFLTEPSFETWRKHSSISLEEESASKRVDRVEEMTIPSDLEDKLAIVRGKIGLLIEQWQRICILMERIIKRREAAAADFARLTNVLKVVVEVNEHCWRGDSCDLCGGIRRGLDQVASHTQRHSDLLEQRSRTVLYSTLESLKSQRDLYIAMRDLFIRHDRLSVDNVDRFKKRVDANSIKLEGVKAAQKEGWQQEADEIVGAIEKDQAAIVSLFNRRIFIRSSMWHELRVVLHNRENALLTQALQIFAREEQGFADTVLANWTSLGVTLGGMPFE